MAGMIQPFELAGKGEKNRDYQLLVAPMMDWMQGTSNQ